jgi:Do/DeqQ family serine protease
MTSSLVRRYTISMYTHPVSLLILSLTLLLMTGGGLNSAYAESRYKDPDRVLPVSRDQVQLSFAPLVKQARMAVVNIYTRKVVQKSFRSPFFNDPFFKRFFGEDFALGTPRKRIQNSLGSGVIVRSDGLVVTNHHVIKGADEITVVLADRREFEATVVVKDERTDLAVLQINPEGTRLSHLELIDSDDLQVGDLVLAIGNPFGVGQTVTSGIVSALARTQVGVADFASFIQTDAAINPGNSGGALVTMDGRLAGVNTAIFSRSGGSNGIGFAIPANMVRAVVDGAISGGEIVRPWLGASGQAVTRDIAAAQGLDRPGGVLINSIFRGGPADDARLQVGDIVTAVDGHEIFDPQGLRFRIATRQVGGLAELSLLRRGKSMNMQVALMAAPETPKRNVATLQGRHILAGATIGNLSPAFAEELGLDTQVQGVIVLQVARNSPASRLRLRPGDLLLRINKRAVKRVRNVKKMMSSASEEWLLAIKRGDQVLQVRVRG